MVYIFCRLCLQVAFRSYQVNNNVAIAVYYAATFEKLNNTFFIKEFGTKTRNDDIVCMCPTSLSLARCDTRSVFKRSTADLNSAFSSLGLVTLQKNSVCPIIYL